MKPSTMNAIWLVGAVLILTVPIPERAQSAPQDIVVTEKDNGKDITLHGDQRLIIRLPAPGGTPYFWSALMTQGSLLAFTAKPAPTQQKQESKTGPQDIVMVGGSHDDEFAFCAARFTESSSEWFTLIFCTAQCDLKDRSAKTFKLGITTKKN
jgi:predicted secreted protein